VGHKSSHDGLSLLKRYPSSLSGVPAQACSYADPFSELIWRSITTPHAAAQFDFAADSAQGTQAFAQQHGTRAADALAPAISELYKLGQTTPSLA
jgi:hypothetical protein